MDKNETSDSGHSSAKPSAFDVHTYYDPSRGDEVEERKDGTIVHRRHGLIHRDGDLPAIEKVLDGKVVRQEWYQNGKHDRKNGKPAQIELLVEHNIFIAAWFEDGLLSRDETAGPARLIRYQDGVIQAEYLIEGRLSRRAGPAVGRLYPPDAKYDGKPLSEWYLYGRRHRTNGPAEEYKGGFGYFFLDGVEYEDERAYKREMKKRDITYIRAVKGDPVNYRVPTFEEARPDSANFVASEATPEKIKVSDDRIAVSRNASPKEVKAAEKIETRREDLKDWYRKNKERTQVRQGAAPS